MGKTEVKVKRKLSCGAKCLKFLLCFFNIIFLIAGITVLAVGVYVLISAKKVAAIFGSELLLNSSYVLMIAGAIAIIMAFLGCCGAWKEIRCILITYVIALVIIFIAELVGGVLAYAYRDTGKSLAKESMESTLKLDYGTTGSGDVTEQWDDIQKDFKCCGVEGNSTDAYLLWQHSAWYEDQSMPKDRVPPSCCIRVKGDVQDLNACQKLEPDPNQPSQVYTEGCFDKVYASVLDNSHIIGGVGVGIAFIQIFGMVFAVCLFRQL
ncbi:CD151 antigen-like [Glandiceps talaboti]